MGYKDRIRRRIRRLQTSDIPALRDFLRREYRPGAIHGDERHHRWLFDENPDNGTAGPQYWIYQREGAVHGQQAGIPFVLLVKGAELRASWAINLKVSPRYRMSGAGAVLNELYVRENEVTAAVNMTDAAKGGFLRAGWEFLGSVPKYVRPLTSGGIRAGMPGVLGSLAPVAYPLLRGLDFLWEIYRRMYGFRLEPVTAFDRRADEIWKGVGSNYPVVARRDYARLRWRFDSAPRPERYHRFYLYRGKRLEGYAVLRYGIRNGRRVAMVVDLLCAPRRLRALLALCAEQARSAGMDDLQAVMCPCPNRSGSLLAAGFLLRDSSEHGFMVFPGGVDEGCRELLCRRDNWFVTMADSDLEWMILREEEAESARQADDQDASLHGVVRGRSTA